MLVGDMAPIAAGRDERDVGARERLQGAPDALQGCVSGQLHHATMERSVGGRLGGRIVNFGGALHLADERRHFLDVLVGQARDRQPSAEGLQLGADHESFEELGR